MDKNTRNGLIFVLFSALGYAFLPIWIKLVYQYSTFDGFEITAWRFMLTVPILWGLVMGSRRYHTSASLTDRLPRLKLMGLGALMAIGALSVAYGLGYIDANIYIVIFRTQPAMVLVIASLLGERIPLRGWLALGMVMIGIVLIKPEIFGFSLSGGEMRGVIAALTNALAIAFYAIGLSRVIAGHTAKARAGAWTLTGTLLTVLPVGIIMSSGLSAPENWQTWAALTAMAVGTALPVVAVYEGIARLGASRFALISSIEPVIALFLTFVILDERLMPIQIMGAAFIISSVVILEAKLPHGAKLTAAPAPTASGD